MGWPKKVLALCKKYGSAAKFAATTILSIVPGGPALTPLVEKAFDAAKDAGQGDWEQNLLRQVQLTADGQSRLEQVLDVMGGDLQHVFAQLASLEQMPAVARQMLEVSQATDARCQQALQKLEGIAQRFDRLEAQGGQILDGQRDATGMLKEMLPLVKGLSEPKAAPEPTLRDKMIGTWRWDKGSDTCDLELRADGTFMRNELGKNAVFKFFAGVFGNAVKGYWRVDGKKLKIMTSQLLANPDLVLEIIKVGKRRLLLEHWGDYERVA